MTANRRRLVLTPDRDDVLLTDIDNTTPAHRIARSELSQVVADLEAAGALWIWERTSEWYGSLLRDGQRIRRCVDLRAQNEILRTSPGVDTSALLLTVDPTPLPTGRATGPTLFDTPDELPVLDLRGECLAQSEVLPSARFGLLLDIQSTAMLAAEEMTFVGLPWSTQRHSRILEDSIGPRPDANERPSHLAVLAEQLRKQLHDPNLNPDSPAAVLASLQRNGIDVTNTRTHTLERIDNAVVPVLLEYKKLQRLNSANGWRWLDEWVRDGRYRTTYMPGGVVSGRWAASGGGALSLPTALRPAVVADDDWTFVVADVAQLEPRVLAAMSADEQLASAARKGDLYQGLVDNGTMKTRNDAKLGMLGAMYGATRGESGALVQRLTRRYPKSFGLVESAARIGEQGGRVQTFLGRGSPVVEAESIAGETQRRAWGRFTRNFVVQGTGAEWATCWLNVLRRLLWDIGAKGLLSERPHLVFFLHDEIVVHTPRHMSNEVAEAMKQASDIATRVLFGDFPIDFPLQVAQADCYADAK